MPQPFRVAILVSLLIVNGVSLAFALSLAEHLASGHLIGHKVGNGTSEFCVFSLQSVVLVLKSDNVNLEPINKFFEIFFH
mgnify:CR=1 FL=1